MAALGFTSPLHPQPCCPPGPSPCRPACCPGPVHGSQSTLPGHLMAPLKPPWAAFLVAFQPPCALDHACSVKVALVRGAHHAAPWFILVNQEPWSGWRPSCPVYCTVCGISEVCSPSFPRQPIKKDRKVIFLLQSLS